MPLHLIPLVARARITWAWTVAWVTRARITPHGRLHEDGSILLIRTLTIEQSYIVSSFQSIGLRELSLSP